MQDATLLPMLSVMNHVQKKWAATHSPPDSNPYYYSQIQTSQMPTMTGTIRVLPLKRQYTQVQEVQMHSILIKSRSWELLI